MKNFFSKILFFCMLSCFIIILPLYGSAGAVSIIWFTSFDCNEWVHNGSDPNCDDLVIASDSRKGTRITSDANYPGGDGGRGLRQYLGDGNNNQTSGLYVVLNSSQSEMWIRWYMRYMPGFKWNNNWPSYDKWLYIYGSSGNIVPEWDGDEVNIWSSYSGNHKQGTTHWQAIMGGTTGDGKWHCYEIHIKSGTSGIGEMWIDGKKYLNYQNYNHGSSSGWDQIVIGSNCNSPNNGSPPGYVDFDDIAISTNGYIGPVGSKGGAPPEPPTAPTAPTGLKVILPAE